VRKKLKNKKKNKGQAEYVFLIVSFVFERAVTSAWAYTY
jgi:hypothetical protein